MGRSSRAERSPRPQLRLAHVALLATLGGLVAARAGLRPTGTAWLDPALLFVSATLVTAAAAAAPWWAPAGICVLAAALAPGWGWALVGLAGAVIAGMGSLYPHRLNWTAPVATIVACRTLTQVEFPATHGLSSLLSVGSLLGLYLLGSARWPTPLRRRCHQALGAVIGMSLLSVFALAAVAWSASSPLRSASHNAQRGLHALEKGDLPGAASALNAAAISLHQADQTLSAWWARPSALVPIAAQHRAAATALTAAAATALDRSSAALNQVDPARFSLNGGTVDIDAISEMAAPLGEIDRAITGLARVVHERGSPWLAPPVGDRLDTFSALLAAHQPTLAKAQTAINLAPDLLGRNGSRRYLIAFLHPGEARGLGGHMGNFAELTMSDGHMELANFGRSVALNRGGVSPGDRVLSGPPGFAPRWARFGFVESDGTTDLTPWSNVTMPPDLPMVGEVMAQLYPQSGGAPIDGVIALLPEALAALMRSTGPVQVPGIDQLITAENVVRFVEKDQYRYFDGNPEDRIDGLEYLALTTVGRLLDGGLGQPTRLFESFAPLAADGRIMVWSTHPDEARLFVETGIGGNFPALKGRDGISVTIDNGGANKLDAYLSVHTDYRSKVDPSTGTATATATITLANTVDPVGQPDYAVGNAVGLPRGTNRMMISVYSALRASAMSLDHAAVTIDGHYASVDGALTFGWHTAELWIDVEPGTTRVVTMRFAGSLDPASTDIVVHPQPMAIPQRYDVARA